MRCVSVLISLVATCLALPAAAAEKHALLIGVASYPASVRSLPGAPHDADKMARMLQQQFHFPADPGHLTILNTPSTTTRARILAALGELADRTRSGDIVFIAFSGHGMRVPDQSPFEESDQADEALIATEGPPVIAANGRIRPDGLRGAILDDEIAGCLSKILDQKPANLTLVVDACNSGGLSRGLWTARGIEAPPQVAMAAQHETGLWTRDWTKERTQEWAQKLSVLDCFYAAESGTSADEAGLNGAFTAAFIEAALPGRSCREVELLCQQKLRPRQQRPYAECARGHILLGTEAAEFPTFSVTSVGANGASGTLNAGQAQGIRAGTLIGIYAPATRLHATDALWPPKQGLLQRAKVEKAEGESSHLIAVDADGRPMAQGQLVPGGKALVLARNYGDLRVPVFVEGAAPGDPMLQELADSTILRVLTERNALATRDPASLPRLWLARAVRGGQPAWEIRAPHSDRPLPAQARDGQRLVVTAQAVFALSDTASVSQALEHYAQSLNLRDLENAVWPEAAHRDHPVRVEVVELIDGREVVADHPDGVWLLKEGRQVRLRLYNEVGPLAEAGAGDAYRFYYGVLSIAPDGEVVYISPHEEHEKDRLLLPVSARQAYLLVGGHPVEQLQAAQQSADTEYFKIVLSRGTPIDLKPLERPPLLLETVRGGGERPKDPLDQLLQAALGGVRGDLPRPVPPGWFTRTIPYRVIP